MYSEGKKILILHNEYQQPGGEDVVVKAEAELLSAAGYDVRVELLSNRFIDSLVKKTQTLWAAGGGRTKRDMIKRLVEDHQADVVHIHNFFPLLTPSAHLGAADAGAAVVQTLHNYRLICAGATLERNGNICELCLTGSKLWSIRHRCYRNSFIGTAAVLNMQRRSVSSLSWQRAVHRSIALTNFSLAKLVEGGVSRERLVVKPNFCAGNSPPVSHNARRDVTFVGRLTKEKGPWIAVEAFRKMPDLCLNVLGDGPERSRLEANAPPNVKFHGSVSRDKVQEIVGQAKLIVVPSLWYEGFPMSVVEAFSLGTPVIASRIGSLAEIVEDGVNGLTFDPGNISDLVAKLRRLHDFPEFYESVHNNCYRTFREKYSADVNLKLIKDIYREAITESKLQSF